jgi:hypothetical protein
MRGAEKEGAVGLLKGIGKGIGGLILKPGAGKSHSLNISLSNHSQEFIILFD